MNQRKHLYRVWIEPVVSYLSLGLLMYGKEEGGED